MSITPREIAIRFAPPKTDADRTAIKARLCAAAQDLAELIHELVPGSREESSAITALEHTMQWAHAGVDRRYIPRTERKPGPGSRLDADTRVYVCDSCQAPLNARTVAAGHTCQIPDEPDDLPANTLPEQP